MDWGNDPRRLSSSGAAERLPRDDWLAGWGKEAPKDGFALRVLTAWLETARLAEVAGGCGGPGSRWVAESWLAGQREEGEAGGLLNTAWQWLRAAGAGWSGWRLQGSRRAEGWQWSWLAGGSSRGRLVAEGWRLVEREAAGGCCSTLTSEGEIRSWSWSWRQNSWESVKGLLSVPHLRLNWLEQPQTPPYMRLVRLSRTCLMHPDTPARMPRAGSCQPTRSAATRVSDSCESTVVTPERTRWSAGWGEDWASAWGHERAGRVPSADGPVAWSAGRPAVAAGAVPVVCQWRVLPSGDGLDHGLECPGAVGSWGEPCPLGSGRRLAPGRPVIHSSAH